MTESDHRFRGGTPDAEIIIDVALARRLLAAQYPDLAGQRIVPVGSGWDNVILRLGDGLALRLPRRAAAAQLLRHEQRWLPALQLRLPLPIPVPVRVGIAQHGYPWPWSITSWIEGETADIAQPDPDQGEILAHFFSALHRPAPVDAPRNPLRGVPLADRKRAFADRAARVAVKSGPIDHRILGIWADALNAPDDCSPCWIHGDPHPRNIVVANGRIVAVIDWGDLGQGDRASDLAAIWMLFSKSETRERAMAAYGSVPQATWRRARGWAVFYAITFLDSGLTDDPGMVIIANRILENLFLPI